MPPATNVNDIVSDHYDIQPEPDQSSESLEPTAAESGPAVAAWIDSGIDGVTVGHWTHSVARTGCTVVRLPPATVASGEVRGGAPATREFALLDPSRTVGRVDAVVLTGGSAFGLAAADGVMAELEREQRGVETSAGVVPIVIAMGLFDLGVGDSAVRPGPEEGRKAYLTASDLFRRGPVGAGTGATTNKWSGQPEPGGLGAAAVDGPSGLRVLAVVAVNALGAINDGTAPVGVDPPAPPLLGEQTTIGVVVTNARIDKAGCYLLAQSGHDGFARALAPAHTAYDGDALVAAATGVVDCDLLVLRALAQRAVEEAIRSVQAEYSPHTQ